MRVRVHGHTSRSGSIVMGKRCVCGHVCTHAHKWVRVYVGKLIHVNECACARMHAHINASHRTE